MVRASRPFILRVLDATAVLSCALLSGCALFSIKSPDHPLPAHELRARTVGRDYADHVVARLSSEIQPTGTDKELAERLLRLKIGAVAETTRASTRLAPVGSLLDTWAFTLQLKDFVASDSNAEQLGGAQPALMKLTEELSTEGEALVRDVSGSHFARDRDLVTAYVAKYPLSSVDCTRPSLLSTWAAEGGDPDVLHTGGSVAQSLEDVSDRMRIYGERLPADTLWRAELTLDRSGMDGEVYRRALKDIDVRLARISTLADTSPLLAREAIAELRSSLGGSADRMDTSWQRMIHTLHDERVALAANVATERAAMTAAFDLERTRLSADVATMAERAITSSWQEIRRLVREALVLLILLALVVLGLPFAAGYAVGRARARPRDAAS